jgi:HEAT repeat protein
MYAAEAFSNLGDAAGSARLVQALDVKQETSSRLYAAWTLARLGDLRGQPILDELLHHPDEQVRGQAAWTLGQLGGEAGIPSLRQALVDPARPVRLQAVWALAFKLHANASRTPAGS